MKKSWILLVLPFAASAAIFAITFPYGAGIAPDSAAYFSIAHHINAGQGVSAYYSNYADRSYPMAAWPPVYPALLATGMILAHASEAEVAWILNLLLLGLNLWLAGKIVSRATKSALFGVSAQTVLFLTPEWRSYFMWALSEPLFLLMVNASLICCWKYMESARVRWFAASALLAGFSGLVRYVGGVYVAGLALALMLVGSGSFRGRLRNSVNFLILGSVPLAVWSLRNNIRMREVELVSESWAERSFGSLVHHAAHQNGLVGNLKLGMNACVGWVRDLAGPLVSDPFVLGLTTMTGILAVAVVMKAIWMRMRGETLSSSTIAEFLLFLCALFYFLGLAASLTFLRYNAETPLRYEMSTFTHMILAVLILLATVGESSHNRLHGNVGKTAVFICVVVRHSAKPFIRVRMGVPANGVIVYGALNGFRRRQVLPILGYGSG
jgi:hypothetical protein